MVLDKKFSLKKFEVAELDRDSTSKDFGRALETDGAVEITGLDEAIFQELYRQAIILFGSASKAEFYFPLLNWGYKSLSETVNNCPREVFQINYIPENWPTQQLFPDFQVAATQVYYALDKLANGVEQLLRTYLQKNGTMSDSASVSDRGRLSVYRYPPLTDYRAREFRINPHPDMSNALFPHATDNGLEIEVKNHGWVPVDIGQGSVLFLPGTVATYYSNNRLTAMKHRVANPPSGQENVPRYSIVFSFS